MKRIMVFGVAIAGIALIIAACNLGFSASKSDLTASPESPGSPDYSDPIPTGPGALVRMRIPTVSSNLLSSLNATYSPRSSGTVQPQAILFATSANFILSQWDVDAGDGGDWVFVNEWLGIGVESKLGQDHENGDDDDNG